MTDKDIDKFLEDNQELMDRLAELEKREELDKLDHLAAEKIMGWFLTDYGAWVTVTRSTTNKGDDIFHHYKVDYQPTRNIAQAWELLEKLGLNRYRLYKHSKDFQLVIQTKSDFFEAQAETASLAITKACLKAVGVDV